MSRRVTRIELARMLDLEEGFIVELERHAILVPDAQGGYDRVSVERARVCWTMHHSLGVNLEGVEVALHLLERWQADRRRIHALLLQLRAEMEDE